jgi:hypothetical protein
MYIPQMKAMAQRYTQTLYGYEDIAQLLSSKSQSRVYHPDSLRLPKFSREESWSFWINAITVHGRRTYPEWLDNQTSISKLVPSAMLSKPISFLATPEFLRQCPACMKLFNPKTFGAHHWEKNGNCNAEYVRQKPGTSPHWVLPKFKKEDGVYGQPCSLSHSWKAFIPLVKSYHPTGRAFLNVGLEDLELIMETREVKICHQGLVVLYA